MTVFAERKTLTLFYTKFLYVLASEIILSFLQFPKLTMDILGNILKSFVVEI